MPRCGARCRVLAGARSRGQAGAPSRPPPEADHALLAAARVESAATGRTRRPEADRRRLRRRVPRRRARPRRHGAGRAPASGSRRGPSPVGAGRGSSTTGPSSARGAGAARGRLAAADRGRPRRRPRPVATPSREDRDQGPTAGRRRVPARLADETGRSQDQAAAEPDACWPVALERRRRRSEAAVGCCAAPAAPPGRRLAQLRAGDGAGLRSCGDCPRAGGGGAAPTRRPVASGPRQRTSWPTQPRHGTAGPGEADEAVGRIPRLADRGSKPDDDCAPRASLGNVGPASSQARSSTRPSPSAARRSGSSPTTPQPTSTSASP